MKYPHSESLKKNRDFQLLYKEGKSRCQPLSGTICEGERSGEESSRCFCQQKGWQQHCAAQNHQIDSGKLQTA